MINDVQGVGVYFTDPAVNTSSGTIFLSINRGLRWYGYGGRWIEYVHG